VRSAGQPSFCLRRRRSCPAKCLCFSVSLSLSLSLSLFLSLCFWTAAAAASGHFQTLTSGFGCKIGLLFERRQFETYANSEKGIFEKLDSA
jgi:hypothetical protein